LQLRSSGQADHSTEGQLLKEDIETSFRTIVDLDSALASALAYGRTPETSDALIGIAPTI
jgi:hypothetical protein